MRGACPANAIKWEPSGRMRTERSTRDTHRRRLRTIASAAPALTLSLVPGSRHSGVRQRVCNRQALGRDHLEPPECENQQCDHDQEDDAHRSMPSLLTPIPDIGMLVGDERMLTLCRRPIAR